MNTSFLYRTACTRDIFSLIRIENEVFLSERISEQKFLILLRAKKHLLVVAEKNNQIVGYVIILHLNTLHANIHSLAVESLHQHQGIGKKLLSTAEDYALKAGCFSVKLEVHPDNDIAYKLYTSCGYTLITKKPHFYEDGAEAFVLQKKLHNAIKYRLKKGRIG